MSGGTKRKVCAAVSLLGRPRLVLMDEPTSGMDVLAKRQTWRAIRGELAGGNSLIVTSHSMEECEAVCTRIAIMARGRFLCLGTPNHIKERSVAAPSTMYLIHTGKVISPDRCYTNICGPRVQVERRQTKK